MVIKVAKSAMPAGLTAQGKAISSKPGNSHDRLAELELELKSTKKELKAAKRELKSARHELHYLLDKDTDAIRVINKDSSIRFINKAFAEMTGVDQNAATGKKCWEVFASPFCRTKNCRLTRVLNGETIMQVEIERTKRDGTIIPCIVNSAPMYSDANKVIGVIETFTDITEKKQLEADLEETEERYRALIELGTEAGEAIVMLQDIEGKEGVQTYMSDQWPRLVGYTKEELLGTSFFDLINPEDRQGSIERHRKKMSGMSVPGLFEMRVTKKDKREITIELTGAFSNYEGKRANVLYIIHITQRKDMQDQLEKSENLYRTLFNTTGTASSVLDNDGTLLLVNDEWSRLFGYSRDEAEGKMRGAELVPENKRKFMQNNFISTKSNYASKGITKKRELKDLLVTANLIPGTDMRIVSCLDITQIKEIERRLINSESRLRLLSRRIIKTAETERQGIARELHDELSQNLVVTRIEAISLAEQLQAPDQARRMSCIVERIDHLIETVRNISTNLRPIMLDELGLVGAVHWYIEDFERRTGMPCLVNIDNNITKVLVTPEVAIEAYRIIQEAMLNALVHSKATNIIIGMSLKSRKLIVDIADNGIGIDIKKRDGSSSLGLLGMQERAALAGGSLQIQTYPARGTRITAFLPVNENISACNLKGQAKI
jgi:PAS domain S-box-containing protein